MPDFEKLKDELAGILKAQKIPFRDWGDALSIRFSDGCDDLYYTRESVEDPAQTVDKFRQLDLSRNRLLNALRHAALHRSLFLKHSRSGSWSVGSRDGASWSVEVGSELTKLIAERGEAEAFRIKLKELYSWETGIGCLGAIVQGGVMLYKRKFIRGVFKVITGCVASVAGGLAKNITSSISFNSTDKQLLAYIDAHSRPPAKEPSWDEFEKREEKRESIELFPADETEDGEDSALDDFFSKHQGAGPPIIELDKEKTAETDRQAESIVKTFLQSLDHNRIAYEKLSLPWFKAPNDVWADRDFLIEKIETLALHAREKDDFWTEIGCLEQLLVLQCGKYRERTRQLMDEWWEGGGHDMQDYVDLLKAFPDHPATAEMLEEHEMSPEHSMEARRRFEIDIQHEWYELKKFSRENGIIKLDDILEILEKLSLDMIKMFMSEVQIRYIHDLCMEAAGEASIEDIQFTHEHILSMAWKMNWPEVARALRERQDYGALLFGFSMPAAEIEALAGRIGGAAGSEKPLPEDVLDIFDTYYFAKSLLIWSLYMPDEDTRRLAATALELLDHGKGGKDDYLACAIAWKRCRSR
jgi:hypothetical protein